MIAARPETLPRILHNPAYLFELLFLKTLFEPLCILQPARRLSLHQFFFFKKNITKINPPWPHWGFRPSLVFPLLFPVSST